MQLSHQHERNLSYYLKGLKFHQLFPPKKVLWTFLLCSPGCWHVWILAAITEPALAYEYPCQKWMAKSTRRRQMSICFNLISLEDRAHRRLFWYVEPWLIFKEDKDSSMATQWPSKANFYNMEGCPASCSSATLVPFHSSLPTKDIMLIVFTLVQYTNGIESFILLLMKCAWSDGGQMGHTWLKSTKLWQYVRRSQCRKTIQFYSST